MTWGYVFYSFVLLPLIFLAYVWLGVWLLRRVQKSKLNRATSIALVLVVVLVLVAVPFGDIAIGRYKFATLCGDHAVLMVHRTVLLEPKYMRPDGWPIAELLPNRTGYRIGDRYTKQYSDQPVHAWPRIEQSRTEIRDEVSGHVLGEIVDFRYWGGWVRHQLPGHISAETCAELREKQTPIEKAVFKATK